MLCGILTRNITRSWLRSLPKSWKNTGASTSVSYTHLDVYKRQFVDRFAIKNLIPDQANIIKVMLFNSIAKKVNFTPEAVSYTHLDVYKRQVPLHAGTKPGCLNTSFARNSPGTPGRTWTCQRKLEFCLLYTSINTSALEASFKNSSKTSFGCEPCILR